MTRDQLEHLIRAAAVIADDDTIVVIGSQAVLGQFPDAPEPMRISEEADLFPLHHPERADLIEGSIGELSPFRCSAITRKESLRKPRSCQTDGGVASSLALILLLQPVAHSNCRSAHLKVAVALLFPDP